MIQNQIPEQIKLVGDGAAVAGTVATLVGWLPHIAALLSVIWTLLRISETERFKQFIKFISKKIKGN